MEILRRISRAVSRSLDNDEVTLFVRTKFRDETEEDTLVYVKRDDIDAFLSELVERADIKEAWVFEQIHHHEKAYPPAAKPLVIAPELAHI